MVERVFCYSKEEAKKNGNIASIGKMFLFVIMIGLVGGISMVFIVLANEDFNSAILPILLTLGAMLVLIAWLAIRFNEKSSSQLSGFAIDTDNNVYSVFKFANTENPVYMVGIVEGIGRMQSPEYIAKIVESPREYPGVVVKQILKVYNYKENSHKVKIKCDYRTMHNGKIKHNKTLDIYKSYDCCSDLINILLNKQEKN